MPKKPWTDDTTTTRPSLFSSKKCRAHRRPNSAVLRKFVSINFRSVAASVSSALPRLPTPPQSTTTSKGFFRTSRSARSTESGLLWSNGTTSHDTAPLSRQRVATRSSSLRRRADTITLLPRAAYAAATSSPRPPEAPVTQTRSGVPGFVCDAPMRRAAAAWRRRSAVKGAVLAEAVRACLLSSSS